MEIVTEINEKVYKKLGIPKENLPEMIHSTKRFGYQKSQNVGSIEFLPKFFLIFSKKFVKILIKMLG
jgi:glycerol kinase